MYGFHTPGSAGMVCQHIADWSRQVLRHIETLREAGIPAESLDRWRERFAELEEGATALLGPWQWNAQGSGAVAGLLARAHHALTDFTRFLQEAGLNPQVPQRPAPSGEEAADRSSVPIGGHQLPPLPYPYDALEPHIDARTMQLHHDRHHKSYVDGLNKAERMMAEARRTGDFDLIKHWEREAAFHGAGHYLHTLFWTIMGPGGGGRPDGPLLAQIEHDFGEFDQFQKHFSAAAEKVEGGGWALWVWSPRANRTEILTAEKHQNLSQWEAIPLLVLDVWEHSYYLKYQDDRKAYIRAWWNVVNWPEVARRYQQARHLAWRPA